MSLFAKYSSTFFHERTTNIHALSLTELNSLKRLAKDPNIVVSKFDKGNGVAILNISDYEEKMLKILNDRTKFVPVGKDDNLQKLDQFQRCIRYLKGKGAITNEDYQRIYPTSAVTPTMYGLPKVHKDGTPLRPNLASTGSFNHECAKWLSDVLSPLRSDSTNLKDTFSFIDKVKNFSLNDSVMYSFDVVSLFTNIPLQFTLQLILDTIFKDNIETFHNLNKRRLKTLLNWAASSTTLQFQGKYYKQVDRIAMGSPIALMLADVFMNHVIEEALSASQQNRPTLLLRYVDDLFLVFSNDEEAQSFFDVMNRIHKSINFTQEQECNGQLAFLDVLVSRNTGNVTQTSVFRKKTHTGLYLKWTSFVPYRYKRNLVNSLLQRAYKIGSSYKLIHSDFMRIKEMLAKNGYPRTFVDNCIRGFLNSKHTDTKRTNQITTQPTQKHLTCRLPYLGPISMQVQHEIGNYFAKNTNGKIKVRVIHDTFKLKSFFRVKEGQALLHRSNVVYHIHCSCGSNYIGETARNLLTRLNEHNPGSKKCKNTDVTNHLYENSDHKIDFAKPKILRTARNRTKLFILETLSIDKLKPDINVDQSLITLYLFNT